ncbi:polysaccharide deacetylase family protein [Microbacterium gorillae]|uniref:polysaccharide deacetylase family protein n=1 Tax=Microbacterium gorillae TaxID=1231063 RepID=UPI000A5A99BF|nr:polysaccharide deacetylase family protein [Microbacterium gorillae]
MLTMLAGGLTGLAAAHAVPAAAAPSALVAPPPPPPILSDSQRLVVASGDPTGCAVDFTGDGISEPPRVERIGQRYERLPIPRAEGRVFAGWYADAASAQARDGAGRINGADTVTCDARRERTLHAAWMTPSENAAAATAVPILMYHQFTDKPDGEPGWLKLNFYGISDWRADMEYIADGGFYLPTWDELEAFIDGALYLPPRSVIVTDDDADSTWLQMAVPVATQNHVLTTSFVITSARQAPTPSIWVQQRSHTHDMHTAGANGRGRMVNWTVEQIAADLDTSAKILGAKEVIAYPYGHYDDRSKQGVAAAGFDLAVTTEHGYVRIGSDKLALPRVRMNFGMTVDDLASLIG